jgi:2-amino-4-hydroxy-6-hydroxymethyldihydropteridine diphosphokinase
MDNPFLNINQAFHALKKYGKVLKSSSFYYSHPYGNLPQASYINKVCKFESPLRPQRLLRGLKRIELELGRIRSFPHGPRTIDIDIIEWEGLPQNTDILTIPHPDYHNRDFVLIPLQEMEPDFNSFYYGITISDLMAECHKEETINICRLK